MLKISKKLAKKVFLAAVEAIIIFDFVLLPLSAPAYAKTIDIKKAAKINLAGQKLADFKQNLSQPRPAPKLPQAEFLRPKIIRRTILTAYSSDVSQCDASPCITASGFNVCQHGIEDTVAANFLPLGAKIRIPEYFGNRIFVVRDRMNPRYRNRIDIWMATRDKAIKFGLKRAAIEILAD